MDEDGIDEGFLTPRTAFGMTGYGLGGAMFEVIYEEALEEGLDGFEDHIVDAVEVVGGDYVRGQDVDDVA